MMYKDTFVFAVVEDYCSEEYFAFAKAWTEKRGIHCYRRKEAEQKGLKFKEKEERQ